MVSGSPLDITVDLKRASILPYCDYDISLDWPKIIFANISYMHCTSIEYPCIPDRSAS